jgi:mRNA interferase RelE/StbE
VRDAATRRPEFRKLAGVIEQLGRLAGDVAVPTTPAREPVPGWLAQRLIHTVGMAPQDVAALSLEEAVDRWGDFTSKPR